MKKDQSLRINDPLRDAKSSSTALTLQQLNKEKEKKDTAEEGARSRCKICFKEIAPVRRCFGHGGGGGGGGSSDSEKKEEEESTKNDEYAFDFDKISYENSEELVGDWVSLEDQEELDTELQASEDPLNPDIIADLVDRGLLSIKMDRKTMTLSIQFNGEMDALSKDERKELKKFMELIKAEFNKFKEQYHLSNDCLSIIEDKNGNILSLTIQFPKLELYDAFIKQLANNLVPVPRPNPTDKEEQGMKSTAPNPFSTEPKPSSKVKESLKNASGQKDENSELNTNKEETVKFNPSPFSMDLKRD